MVLLNYTLRNGQDDKLYVMCTLPHFLNFLINLFYRWTEKDVEAKEVFDTFITT